MELLFDILILLYLKYVICKSTSQSPSPSFFFLKNPKMLEEEEEEDHSPLREEEFVVSRRCYLSLLNLVASLMKSLFVAAYYQEEEEFWGVDKPDEVGGFLNPLRSQLKPLCHQEILTMELFDTVRDAFFYHLSMLFCWIFFFFHPVFFFLLVWAAACCCFSILKGKPTRPTGTTIF